MQQLAQLLTPARTLCQAPGISRKRLFETIASVIAQDQLSLPSEDIFSQLIAREKLGSTGLGKGIAIPHCRIENCTHPLGTLVTLQDPIDFESPDNQPVDLLFVLLVPNEAHQLHLDILANVAGLFRQDSFCEALRAAGDNAQLHEVATTWPEQ